MAFITIPSALPFEAGNADADPEPEGVLLLVSVLGAASEATTRVPARNLSGLRGGVPHRYVLAFAAFGNFGILARQRVLVMPFAYMLLALPRPVSTVLDNLPTRSGTARALPGATQPLVMSRR